VIDDSEGSPWSSGRTGCRSLSYFPTLELIAPPDRSAVRPALPFDPLSLAALEAAPSYRCASRGSVSSGPIETPVRCQTA
jgi:hypothetical protein